MTGSWEVNVSIDGMPEKVATAFTNLTTELVGAEYTPIAYLGSQIVNGINHAVLAEQLITNGRDTKNIVLLIFNEKGIGCTLANIERVVSSGDEFGGVKIDVEKGDQINKTAQQLFDQTFAGFCGSVITPIALLGTQVIRGTEYIFACEVAPVLADNDVNNKKVKLITISDTGMQPRFVDILCSVSENDALADAARRVGLQSPWVLFYKEAYALFRNDPQVEVLFNNEEPELKFWVHGNDEKAAALARFMPSVKKFGNPELKISVVGDDGEPVPDINCTDQVCIHKIFEGNGAMSYIKDVETIFGDNLTYCIFKREVVSYYSDDLTDYFGVTSTLYQYLADDIFADTLVQSGTCFFCTDIEESTALGSPLGEWP